MRKGASEPQNREAEPDLYSGSGTVEKSDSRSQEPLLKAGAEQNLPRGAHRACAQTSSQEREGRRQ